VPFTWGSNRQYPETCREKGQQLPALEYLIIGGDYFRYIMKKVKVLKTIAAK